MALFDFFQTFRFEVEHVFSQLLFDGGRRQADLEAHGYKQQMRENQIGLFSDAGTVDSLQKTGTPATNSLKSSS